MVTESRVVIDVSFFGWGGSLSVSGVVSSVAESELLSSGSLGSLVSVSLLSLVSVLLEVESCSE